SLLYFRSQQFEVFLVFSPLHLWSPPDSLNPNHNRFGGGPIDWLNRRINSSQSYPEQNRTRACARCRASTPAGGHGAREHSCVCWRSYAPQRDDVDVARYLS